MLDLRDRSGPTRHDASLGTDAQSLDLALQPAAIGILEKKKGPFVADRHHGAERRIEPSGEQRTRHRAGRRRADDPGERGAEAAARLVAGVKLHQVGARVRIPRTSSRSAS